MDLNHLTAISPIDGRYGRQTAELMPIFSEYGLMRLRVKIEILWLQTLSKQPNIKELPEFTNEQQIQLNQIADDFSEHDALRVKEIEQKTNHDVKAIEYFIKEKMATIDSMKNITEFVHFACTSEDINNLCHALMLKRSYNSIVRPKLCEIIAEVASLAVEYAEQPMLSRTHGQTASPTTMGKEMGVFAHRLERQLRQLDNQRFMGKFNGAVGNFNAHLFSYPNVDWATLAKEFTESLGLEWNPYTTQIESHDYMAEYFQGIARFNAVLIDCCRDLWGYISLNYLKQCKPPGQTGSSTMPHKINPIDFENAEANLELSNCVLLDLAKRLPVSRWQRDLTDSTTIRNNGVAIAYSLIAYKSYLKGLSKLDLNAQAINDDLENAWAVLAEPIQTVMRRYNIEGAYEKLKKLTYGRNIDANALHKFIGTLNIPEAERQRLLALTPANYIGNAVEQARSFALKFDGKQDQ